MTRVLSSRQARRPAARAASSCADFSPLTGSPPPLPVTTPAAGTVEGLERRVLMSVYTVTTTADDGPGSLRQTIERTNGSGGADEIRFDIPAPAAGTGTIPGVRTIL